MLAPHFRVSFYLTLKHKCSEMCYKLSSDILVLNLNAIDKIALIWAFFPLVRLKTLVFNVCILFAVHSWSGCSRGTLFAPARANTSGSGIPSSSGQYKVTLLFYLFSYTNALLLFLCFFFTSSLSTAGTWTG